MENIDGLTILLFAIIIGFIIFIWGLSVGYDIGTREVINYVENNLSIEYIKELVNYNER